MSSPNECSFLPDDYLLNKAQKRTNVICAMLFIVVMSGIVVAFMTTDRMMRNVEKQYAATDAHFTEAAKRIGQVREMHEKQRRMSSQAELTASLLEKVPRSYLLADLTNALPPEVSLLQLDMQSKLRGPTTKKRDASKPAVPKAPAGAKPKEPEPAAPEPRVYDVSLKLTGIARNDSQVAQFITRLNASNLYKEVNLVISEEHVQEDTGVRKFLLEITLDPAAAAPSSVASSN